MNKLIVILFYITASLSVCHTYVGIAIYGTYTILYVLRYIDVRYLLLCAHWYSTTYHDTKVT